MSLRSRAPQREDGFTVVEVLVAILVLAIGAIAILQVFDVASRNTFRAEQTQVAIDRAQREMESIRNLAWEEVALTATPGTSGDADDPRNRVSGTSYALSPGGGNLAPMVIENVGGQDTGSVDPGPTPFTSGDVSGTVHRYVVWQDDPSCAPTDCPGSEDFKRVVIAVTIDDGAVGGERAYREVQGDFTDPEAVSDKGAGPGSGDQLITAQQFFFSDTRCGSGSGDPTRQEPSDHPTHDTLGGCGVASGDSTRPNALLVEAPRDPAPADPLVPPLYDYATDVEPGGGTAPDDFGLQMLAQDTDGCNASPIGSERRKQIHRWVTRPMPSSFTMNGQATIELYTRTINDVSVPGAICIYLYRRNALDVATPITITNVVPTSANPYGFSCATVGTSPAVFARCATNLWPQGNPQRVRFNLSFASNLTLPADERLEVAISVDRSGTPENALQFMYDHPDYLSRIEVKTTTPLAGS